MINQGVGASVDALGTSYHFLAVLAALAGCIKTRREAEESVC